MDVETVRILHVVGGMNYGGVETWLMHVLRNIDRKRFQMDFLVRTTQPCAYDDEIRALGSQIIPCPGIRQPLSFARKFKRLLREYGPYDIVHSHSYFYSGWILRLAHQAGVRVRIAHSHQASRFQSQSRLHRRIYVALMRYWIERHANLGLGISRSAAAALFGPDWISDPRWQLLYYGLNFAPFRDEVEPANVRSSLGIPNDALVVGHVGRFVEQKNHLFLIDVFATLRNHNPNAYLLLVGDGPLRPKIERMIAETGQATHVVLTGFRSDVPCLMRGAMDVLLLPSAYEGLGLVLVEAQAAGLPCVFSDVVPGEVDVVRPLLRRLSLSQPASDWAKTVLSLKDSPLAISPAQSLALMENSLFNIKASVAKLERIYDMANAADSSLH